MFSVIIPVRAHQRETPAARPGGELVAADRNSRRAAPTGPPRSPGVQLAVQALAIAADQETVTITMTGYTKDLLAALRPYVSSTE